MKLYRYGPHMRQACGWVSYIEVPCNLVTRIMIRDAYKLLRQSGAKPAVTRHAVVDLLETQFIVGGAL